MSFGSEFIFTLFTNDADRAARASEAGVERIGLDLEVIDKKERQEGLGSWISAHQLDDWVKITDSVEPHRYFARINPINDNSALEIEFLINGGTKVLMLPMFKTVQEVERFVDLAAGRVKLVLLAETKEAVAILNEVILIDGINEVHIGLNDLHLSLGLNSHFEVLFLPLMEEVSELLNGNNIHFGFGGLGRYDDASLPISPDLLYAEYARLNASAALISRAFFTPGCGDLKDEMIKARQRLDFWFAKSDAELEEAHLGLSAVINPMV